MATGGVWVWQFPDDYLSAEEAQARGTISADDTADPYVIDDVYLKTHDGLYWMGNIYQHRFAPLESNLQELQNIYNAQGIVFTPWCVPKGHWPAEEAAIANKVLAVTGRLILDIEPYQWFWEGPWENLHPYMQAIRAAHPDAWIGLSFDPRYGTYGQYTVDKYAAIHFEEWLPYVDALLPQDYWNTFQVDPVWEIEHTWARIGDLEKEVIFALPGGSNPQDFQRGVEAALERAKVSIWRRGTFLVANAETLRTTEQPEPEDECPALLAESQARVAELEAALGLSEAEVANLKQTMRAAAQALENTAQVLRHKAGD